MEPLLQLRGISKAFPGVRALDNISFDVYPGEVHALLGENGAGKSTLIKIISGVYRPDSGTMTMDGQPADFADPGQAQARGIAAIYQELGLYPDLSVAENLRYVGQLRLLTRRQIEERGQHYLEMFDMARFKDRLAGSLSGGSWANAMSANPRTADASHPTRANKPRNVIEPFMKYASVIGRGRVRFPPSLLQLANRDMPDKQVT